MKSIRFYPVQPLKKNRFGICLLFSRSHAVQYIILALLNKSIVYFIKNGKIIEGETKRSTTKIPDKLLLDTIIENYKNNKQTKEFILKEAFKKEPVLKTKSGSIYWLNRWREDKIKNGIKITYEDLINESPVQV